ncbi:Cthe_2314 family HEPN domain-containing protein [Stutzerimonas nitrititolerans]|uniref:Cthe_2314 family HEPN domain-containing protein n=1 Tax=Stutzerimonas nitrititolerans TaxID=2482751 RepID=UPI001BD4C01F|nr:Cthe_2314 family HEPN domain-containing protein [Stutzerimonas nitrititolerans]
MNNYTSLTESEFSQAVFRDTRESMKNSQKSTLIPEDAEVDEYQFYLQGVGFHLAHALTWMRQLELAVELLTNYDYSKRISASRADHLIYNIENYLIRLNSTYDRLLQLTNAVFHLCISEEHVSHSVIISNAKVQHCPDVVSNLKAVKKHLDKNAQERHTIIHKHSLLDEKLRRVELLYHDEILEEMSDERKAHIKTFRANHLREYVIAKKTEFKQMNAQLAKLVATLFAPLLAEYLLQKQQFKVRGF